MCIEAPLHIVLFTGIKVMKCIHVICRIADATISSPHRNTFLHHPQAITITALGFQFFHLVEPCVYFPDLGCIFLVMHCHVYGVQKFHTLFSHPVTLMRARIAVVTSCSSSLLWKKTALRLLGIIFCVSPSWYTHSWPPSASAQSSFR